MNKMFRITANLIVVVLASGCLAEESFYSNLLKSDVYTQQYDDTKFDFLWVLDNSASMTARRQFIKDNMQTFLNILNSRKAVDFQMAVTTTDMFSDSGQLVTAPGGLRVVKSATSTNAAADFASIVDAVADSPTSFWEQGLESAYQAVAGHQAEFSRPGVPLVIIMVTDEDDFSCMDHCFGVEPENNPDDVVFNVTRYVDYFKGVKAAEKSTTSVFPIVGLSTGTCTVASFGDRYQEVVNGMGGESKTGSICNGELRESYESIARIIADRGRVFRLSSPSSSSGIRVFVDGKLVPFSPENYTFDATENSIVFTGFVPKSGSVIEVSYSQSNE